MLITYVEGIILLAFSLSMHKILLTFSHRVHVRWKDTTIGAIGRYHEMVTTENQKEDS